MAFFPWRVELSAPSLWTTKTIHGLFTLNYCLFAKYTPCIQRLIWDIRTMNLQQIRAPTLKPLRDYVRQASQQGEIEDYQQLTPALRLYLSNNMLEEVPGEVYQLENLEVLSLRNNCLTEISPSM